MVRDRSRSGEKFAGRGLVAAACLILVAACTSTEATLDPAALSGEPAINAPVTTAGPTPTATPTDAQQLAAVSPATTRVQFVGLIGAPEAAIAQFSARLTEQSAANNFAVVPANDPTAVYKLKGFASTSPEDGQTAVFYVWDVADAKGARVHRFSGQHNAAGQGQGWAAVTTADIQAIADKSAADFAAWLANPSR